MTAINAWALQAGQIGNDAFPPFSVTQLRIRNGSFCPIRPLPDSRPNGSVGGNRIPRYCVRVTNGYAIIRELNLVRQAIGLHVAQHGKS